MDTVEIADLYQASYLLMNGCTLEAIECTQTSGPIICKLSFSGANLHQLVMNWFEKKAVVNLAAFRGAYSQIINQVQQAKKDYQVSRRLAVSPGARP